MRLWHSTDVGVSFQRFRDTVVAQTAAVLMNRGSSWARHAVDNTTEDRNYRDAISKILDNSGGSPQTAIDEPICALQARRDRPGFHDGPRAPARERRPPPTGESRPRMCANCGGILAAPKCLHLEVPKELRKCWIYKKIGHPSR